MSLLTDFGGIRCCSFPHGKNMPVILAIALSTTGLIISGFLVNEVAVGIGFVVALLVGLTSCMVLPPLALNLAAVAALANAGAHLAAAHALYKSRKGLGSYVCSTLKQTLALYGSDGTDDGIFSSYYAEYRKYCGNGIYIWNAVALLVWVAAGIVIFLVPSRDQREATLGNSDEGERGGTRYRRQKDVEMT